MDYKKVVLFLHSDSVLYHIVLFAIVYVDKWITANKGKFVLIELFL